MAIQDLTASLDLKQNLNIYATCKQLDNLNLILNIYDNSVQADLTGYDVRLVAMKADKIPLIQEHTGITITNNVVTIVADEQLTTTSGKTLIELQFINNSTGQRKATFNLALIVNPSTLEVDSTISTATYTLMQQFANELDRATDYFNSVSEFQTDHPEILNLDDRVSDAEAEISTLASTKTNDIDNTRTTSAKNVTGAINELNSSKASASSVQTLSTNVSNIQTAFNNIGSATPKGTYSTLTALQTAYPTGTTGIYIITADGKWYFWNGSAWTAGGIYQSAVLADGSVTNIKKTLLGEFGFLTSSLPININTKDKTIEFPSTGSIYITYRNVNHPKSNFLGTAISINFQYGGGFIVYNITSDNIEVLDGLSTTSVPNENYIILGYIYLTPNVSVKINANFTIDGKHDYYKYFNKTINCLGDSTTWGDNSLGTGGNSISWVASLTKLCGFGTVRNYGVNGSKIAVASGRSDSFVERYNTMNSSADVITVLGGVNDFLFGTPLGDIDSVDNTTFYGALKALVNGLINKYTSSKIIFMTPMKVDHATYGNTFQNNTLGLKQIDYVNAIKEVCDYYSINILDMYTYSGISPFNASQATAYMPDKLHYNQAGYYKLAEKIASFL